MENIIPQKEKFPEISIGREMKKSYLDYAMSVIIGRALPDVRDGLKPVHRRILFAMRELKNDFNKPYKKSARIVGDCFVKGALVHTESGLSSIEDIEVGQNVLLPDGSLGMVQQVYHNPPSRLVRVHLSNGYVFDVTPGQLFRVLNDDLSIAWEKAENLEGRTVLVSNHRAMGIPETHPDTEQSDLAYILGLLTAEGWLTDRGRGKRVGICMTDEAPLVFLADYCAAHGIDAKWHQKLPPNPKWSVQYCLRFTGLDAAYQTCLETSQTKQVPASILQDRRLYAPFLAGFTDGDGHIRARGSRREAVLTSASERLLIQIQAMLADTGVHATLTCEDFKNRSYGDNYANRYNLWIVGEQASLFGDLIRDLLKIENKRRNAEKLYAWTRRTLNTFYESVPSRCLFETLSQHHLGGGWYRSHTGAKFRAGIKYSGGAKIRYAKNLAESDISYRQIQEWGVLAKLERMGSDLAPRLKHLMDTYGVMQVDAVDTESELSAETFDIQIDSSDHEFMIQGCAVHNCIGKYHPHGDSAVYDTIVRMAQGFSMRYPLVDGQGNFGSVDGDPAAAMRYTEIRMTRLAHFLLEDLDKETVDFTANYDDSLTEPAVLPARFPNLLVNGSAGIAVGMATNIPPHNLNEICEAVKALVDDPELSLEALLALVPGPDFPTAGIIHGTKGIRDAYNTGRGIIRVRARVLVEKDKRTGSETIVVTELPYQVNKAKLVENIAELVRNKQIEGIRYVRDESDRQGLRVAMGLKKDQFAEVIINQLFKHTRMESSFGMIFLAVVNNRPELLSLKEILLHFIQHRREVIIRRTRFDLRKAEERAHILEGLKIALENLDAVVALIRRAASPAEAKSGLMETFTLTAIQAQAILDMRLQRLTGLERDKIVEEYHNVLKDIEYFRKILASDQLLLDIVKEEVAAVQSEFGDARRTEIIEDTREITIEDMIVEEDMVVTVSKSGYIKRTPITLYESQRRGGKGKTAMETRDEDFVHLLFVASTHHTFMFFTSRGKVYWRKVYEIPQAGRAARGKAIVNLLALEENEHLTTVMAVQNFEPGYHVLMATRKGYIKKTDLMAYSRPRTGGIIALELMPDDELIAARLTDGTLNVFLGAAGGLSIRFHEADVRTMGRATRGVRGMKLAEGESLVGMQVLSHGQTLFTITENGYGKRTSIDEYPVQKRGGKGVITIKTTERNGKVVDILLVNEDDDLMIIANSGKIIRIPIKGVSVISRNTQGVKLIDMEPGEKVVSAARLAESEASDEEISGELSTGQATTEEVEETE